MKELFRASQHAAESGNWYSRTRVQVAEVLDATGKRWIKPTLVHARKLGLLPGVTTIVRCHDRPMLRQWQTRQAIVAALTLPRHPEQAEADWLAAVELDAQETARKAAERGTMIHRAIQTMVQGDAVDPELEPWARSALNMLAQTFGDVGWISEQVFVHSDGFGTKADLMNPDWVLDFKSTEVQSPETTYEDHWMQLAATRLACDAMGARCAIVYVHREVPEWVTICEIPEDKLERGLGMFRALHQFWKCKNNYDPSWRESA